MMPLRKNSRGGDNSGGGGRPRGDRSNRSGRKVETVKDIETLTIPTALASLKHHPCLSVLDKTGVRVKTNPTAEIGELTHREKLHGKLGNMKNSWNRKITGQQSALTADRQRSTVSCLNRDGKNRRSY